jgi:hypothetical protein
MTRRRHLILPLLAVPLTVGAFGVALVITAFVACGISGCGGGGFGPSFAPRGTQVGLLGAGLTLLPLTLLLLHGRRRRVQAVAGALVMVAGVLAALTLLGLSPSGCPQGHVRVTAAETAFSPGSPTCSGDPDIVRAP